MSYSAQKRLPAAGLAMLMPVTIVCDVPALDDVFGAFDFKVYCDDYDYCCDYHDNYHCDRWLDCDDEWFFDFRWWW